MEDNVDINALTMEQYIALIPYDIKSGIVNPEIGDDVEFEINANSMRELRRKIFEGTNDEDAYEHVRIVLEIVDLFHFPGVTHDEIMLRVFPITLKGRALRWKNRLPAGTITTWDLFKKEFIWRYCHPFITAKKLRNPQFQAREGRDIKVHIFYTGLDISTRKILDSNGFIPLMTPTQALESIQVMADHSHDCYDETTTRERINDNVDAIYESFKGEHLTKKYPLKKEDEAIKYSKYMESLEETIIKFCEDIIKKQTAYDERMRKILENTESNIRALKTTTKNLQEKAYQLTHKVLTNTGENFSGGGDMVAGGGWPEGRGGRNLERERACDGKPKLGLWYPRVYSFDLESYSDSDYAGANLDRKSTTGGCQFLGRRLISWQCKKQTIVATFTTEAEYVAANPVYHSKTKHIAIRHHFIRDAYEKKLIQVLKIHTDDNVADLLTKAFDVSRESLRRVFDGTEALLLPTLFILWLATVSTDSAELVPMGKVSTAIETLQKNTAKALISLSPTITHSNIMAVLESCPKHNMVAYLEKTDGNAEFHEIIDFLTRSSIHHALIFWTSAKSKIINNVRHITAKVAGKPVSISEASIRSDLLFDDANGIDSLPNQAIFDAIQLMGYEGDLTVLTFNKALFSPQWRFLFHTMNHCISSKSTSWDQIPTNIATAVICLTSNQKYNFSKLIFDGMLRHLDAKKKFVMYPRFISIFLDKQLENVPVPLDHFPVNTLTSKVFSFMVKKGKHFSGKVTPLFASMLVQPTEDEGAPSERPSEAQPTPSPPHPSEAPVEPQTDPSPRPSPSTTIPDSIPDSSGGNHGGHSSSDKSLSGNEGEMTLQSVYDLCISLCTQVSDQAKEIQNLKAQIKKLKKQAKPVITHHRAWMKSVSLKHRLAGKRSLKKQWMQRRVTEDAQDVRRTRDMWMKRKRMLKESLVLKMYLVLLNRTLISTDKEKISTDRPIVSTDGSKVSTDKQKDSTDDQNEGTNDHTEGERATQTTQTPTSTIFGDDETIAQDLGLHQQDPFDIISLFKNDPKDKGKKKIEEEDESESESDGIPEAEKKFKQLASDEEMARKARIEADRLLAEKLQEEEREQFTIEEREKFLHDTIAAQRKFLSQQRSEAIGTGPPQRITKKSNETYLKHMKDDQKVNETELIFLQTESVKEEDKKKGSEDEHKKCLKIVTFESILDSEIMEKKSVIARLNKVSSPDGDYLVIYRANGNFRAFNYLMEVLHIFDRQDLFHLYDLIRDQYSEVTLDGFELILWGDLKIMMESSTEGNEQSDFWSGQQEWNIVT
ncbi:hypothetical protein Tco_0291306 [Tanacetum coccineum]